MRAFPLMGVERRHAAVRETAAASDRTPNRVRRGFLDAGLLLQQPGRALPLDVQQQNAQRFGHDFAHVRVHDDGSSAAVAAGIDAQAFTIGADIFFAAPFDPTSDPGGRLLRHELIHVVQQRDARIIAGERVAIGNRAAEAEVEARSMTGNAPGASRFIRSLGPAAVVQCEDAVQPQSTEPRPRSVAAVIALLKQARELSLATPPQDQRALVIVEDVYQFLNRFLWGDTIRNALKAHSGFNATYAQLIIGEAVGGVHSVASFIRLGGHPSSGTWDYNLQKVAVAREYLEVVAGNIEAGESHLVTAVDTATDWGLEAGRLALELTPVIGSLIMLGEALVGKSITGKDLSRGERALLGFGAIVAEVGTLLRAGRMVVAASRLSDVAGVSTTQALRMCWAARTLTETERGLLAQLATKVRSGTALTAREIVLMNRLLGKLAEADRTIAIRATVGAATGEATKAGRFTNLSTRQGASEIAFGQMLAQQLSADVVRVAEDAAAQGAKNPDFLINNTLAELVELETTASAKSPIANALTKIVDKHQQAGMVIVDLTKSAVTSPELLGSADRLWGNPRFLDVARLIVVRAGSVIAVLDRPAGVLEPLVSTAAKGAAKAGEAAVP